MAGDVPKQYMTIGDESLLVRCLHSLAQEPRIVAVQPVIAPGDPYFEDAVAGRTFPFDVLPPVSGGATRGRSMAHGLAALAADVTWVAVHDAARPMPSKALLGRLVDAAGEYGAAVPGLPVADTIKCVDERGFVLNTLARPYLRAIQTPQVARREWFDAAVTAAGERLDAFTDDASLLEAAGFPVFVVEGDHGNRKITTPEDLAWLRRRIVEEEI